MPSRGVVVNEQNQGVGFDIRQHSSPFTSLLEGWDVLLQPPFPKQIGQKLNLSPLLSVNVSLLKDSRREVEAGSIFGQFVLGKVVEGVHPNPPTTR